MTNSLQLDRPIAVPVLGPPLRQAAVEPQALHPAVPLAELVNELKSLRKGRGIHACQIIDRVGHGLREISGVRDDDGAAEVRSKVAQRLRRLADGLPDDLRTAVLTAFAIAPDARQPLYKDRVGLAAARIQRDPRTARRRIDEAIVRLAQLATATGAATDIAGSRMTNGWRITELRLSLALDRHSPELVEQCLLVAERDGVTELPVIAGRTVTFADGSDGELTTDVFYGGLLAHHTCAGTDGGRAAVLAPGHPLEAGESHEYAVRATTRGAASIQPEVGYTADRRCDRLALRVRFDRGAVPRWVYRFGGGGHEVAVDRVGEVHAEFHGLLPGQRYGVRWAW